MQLDTLFQDFPSEQDLLTIIMNTSFAVWKRELVKRDIEEWLCNFTGEVCQEQYERQIALWLFTHFTFYNEDEVRHLCKVVYRDLIHHIVKDGAAAGPEANKLIETFFASSRIVTWEKTSGSGCFISYFFRQANDLPMTLFDFSVDAAAVNPDIESVIIIDDVTLTDDHNAQIYKFLSQTTQKYPNTKLYLLTLVSSEGSIEFLEKTFNVKIISAIKLDRRDKCFSALSAIFQSYPELLDLGRQFAEHYGKKIFHEHPLGYKDGQYAFGFFYNTPDNTLPIFWRESKGWIPVIRRYHKKYFGKGFLANERFI